MRGEQDRVGGDRDQRAPDHLTSAGRANALRARDHRRRVVAEPLLEQRAVDAAEVGGRACRLPSSSRPSVSPGNSPTICPRRVRADQEADAGGAVVGAVEPFSLARRPNSDQTSDEHAVGEAARLEVALEGEQRVARSASRPSGERLRLVGVRVVPPGAVQRDAADRQARAEHRREAGAAGAGSASSPSG